MNNKFSFRGPRGYATDRAIKLIAETDREIQAYIDAENEFYNSLRKEKEED